jgi:DNA adenine methylase
MSTTYTPLRYPGGKSKYSKIFESVLESNGLENATFAEAFAGGAGAAITLLLKGKVDSIFLNDFDKAIYSFWKAIIFRTDEFIELMHNTPVSVEEWKKQKEIYKSPPRDYFKLGFATFFLNRSNIGGILSANPIGGIKQNNKYRIDARFNKKTAETKIRKIASFKDKIKLFNLDAVEFIEHLKDEYVDREIFLYFDPPYYQKGQLLYLNYYKHDDHAELRDHIVKCDFHWFLSYDMHKEIIDLYSGHSMYRKYLTYSITKPSIGEELIVSNLIVPDDLEPIQEHEAA